MSAHWLFFAAQWPSLRIPNSTPYPQARISSSVGRQADRRRVVPIHSLLTDLLARHHTQCLLDHLHQADHRFVWAILSCKFSNYASYVEAATALERMAKVLFAGAELVNKAFRVAQARSQLGLSSTETSRSPSCSATMTPASMLLNLRLPIPAPLAVRTEELPSGWAHNPC